MVYCDCLTKIDSTDYGQTQSCFTQTILKFKFNYFIKLTFYSIGYIFDHVPEVKVDWVISESVCIPPVIKSHGEEMYKI